MSKQIKSTRNRKRQIRKIDELCKLHPDAYLLAEEAALYLNMTSAALAIRRSAGNGPDYCKQGSLIRYQKKIIDKWIDGDKAAA